MFVVGLEDDGSDEDEVDSSPLPSNLKDAKREIRRLRRQLIETNKRWSKLWEKASLDRKAASSLITALRLEVTQLKEGSNDKS